MILHNFTKRIYAIFIITSLILVNISAPVSALHFGRFQNSNIQITSPYINNATVDKVVTVEGFTNLEELWLCLRGPGGELSLYPVDVSNGSFTKDVWLRFGTGSYTIWAGDNAKRFNGSIRFDVANTSSEDYRYLKPSGYVDSESPEISEITESFIDSQMTDMQKTQAVHNWVTRNIKYDYMAYAAGKSSLNTSNTVVESKYGICRDYAFVFAALARNAGIPTKIVYGYALDNATKTLDRHAWNEAYVNGKWINIDTTWDAGYIRNNAFVSEPSFKYFNTSPEVFNKTHKVTSVTLF